MLTQEELKRNLDFSPETGIFTWILSKKGTKIGDIAGSNSRGYIRIRLNKKSYFSHRLAWLWVNGEFPKKQIDHIDKNKSNNRIINLREVSRSENACNVNPPANNTSGFKNVHLHKCGKYVVRIKRDSKTYNLGYYKTAEEANIIAIEGRRNIHKEYAS